MQKTTTTTAAPHFINPEPLTKKSIQENNRQIHLIYTDKQGNKLAFVAVAAKTGGSAFGTIFSKGASSRQWIGKIGDSRSLLQKCSYTFEDMNMDAIFEKLATDLYEELGRGFFKLPKTRLSMLPLINAFGPDKPRWPLDSLFKFIQKNSGKSSLRIMSKYVEGYQDFKNATTSDLDSTSIAFIDFIKKWRRPPESLLSPQGQTVPLYGLIEIIAVGRVLADTDLLGGMCDNAGFVWTSDNGKIVSAHAVKIDPGKAFQFSSHPQNSVPTISNWVLNTHEGFLNGKKLGSLKDIQIAQNYEPITLYWDSLTSAQQNTFLGILFNSSRYLQSPNILNYLFYREGNFQHLPQEIAQTFQDEMKEWLELQLKIYSTELQAFHQKYPDLSLRTHYIDTCGQLKIPMSKETFPIRELFTELVIVQNTNPITGIPEKDSFKETTDHLSLLSNTIPLENLFQNKRTTLLIGRAGIGKSTLCQKIAHDWASGRLWNDTFHAIYWIPLRHLNDAQLTEDPYDFLATVAIPHIFTNLPSANTLAQQIKDPAKKILLILDGYDEASTRLTQKVEQLLKETNFHILITSRPGKVHTLPVDQIVENIGFSDIHIKTYIDKFSKRHDQNLYTKEQILYNTIKESPYLYPVSHIPLQLQMIVSLFEKTGHILQATSLTQLYQLISNALYDWHLPGHTSEEKDKTLTLLGEIAHIGLQCGKLIIPHEKINHLLTPSLLKTGILKKTHGHKVDYYFLHLTFQEYLTAFNISLQSPKKQAAFILENRHKPTHQLVFAFLAGLLRSDPKKLDQFFVTLHQESAIITVSPSYQFELSLRCLNECEGVKDKIPAIDTLIINNPSILTIPFSDGLLPFQSLAAQKQTQALNWLTTHYLDLFQKQKELSASLNPQPNTPTVLNQLIDYVLELLNNETIKKDSVYQILEKKLEKFLDANLDDPLTPENLKLYNRLSKLLDTKGKVRPVISCQLQQLHAKQTSTSSPQLVYSNQTTATTTSPVSQSINSPTVPPALMPTTQTTTQLTTSQPIKAPTSPIHMPNTIISIIPEASSTLIPACAFGKDKWATYFGDIGIEPPLPSNIHQILQGPCPIWQGKRVEETHILVLIPRAVNEQPLTLESLEKLIQKPKTGLATKYCHFYVTMCSEKPVDQSYWVLMTRDILEGSRGKSYKTHFAQTVAVTKKTGIFYAAPKVLEAAVCILMHYVSTGERLYSDDSPRTYTRCEDFYGVNLGCAVVVGNFSSEGLIVSQTLGNSGSPFDGVSVVRKLLEF